MNEARMAEQMARFAISGMQTAGQTAKFLKSLTILFMKFFEKDETRQLLLDFYEAGLREQDKLKPGEKLGILSYEIQPQFAKQLMEICDRDKIAYMNAKLNSPNLLDPDNHEQRKTDNIMIYTTQKDEFYRAIAEARARSGYDLEIPLDIAESFAGKVKEVNPMQQIKDMPLEKYIALRRDIQKLDPDMRFTLFPRFHEKDGEKVVDVGFLSKTEKLYDKRGNVFKEPKTYNISEMVKGILAKQSILEVQNPEKNIYEVIRQKEEFKDKTIDDLLKNKAPTLNSIRKEIASINFDEKEKTVIFDAINNYRNRSITREDLKATIDKQTTLSDNSKNIIKQEIDKLGKEMYIIPAKVIRDGNNIDFAVDMRRSLCIGKDLIVREPGKDDLILDDDHTLKSNIESKLTEFTEKGKSSEFTFIVLTADEFKQIENGNKDFIGDKNKLKKKNIEFLKNKENLDMLKTKDEILQTSKKEDLLIDMINQKKERFILESEQIGNNQERFDEYHESTIENIIMEQDIKIAGFEGKEEILEACKSAANVEIEPVTFKGEFEEYIEEQIDEYDKKETERDNIALEYERREKEQEYQKIEDDREEDIELDSE